MNPHRTARSILRTLPAAALLAVTVSACSGESSSSATLPPLITTTTSTTITPPVDATTAPSVAPPTSAAAAETTVAETDPATTDAAPTGSQESLPSNDPLALYTAMASPFVDGDTTAPIDRAWLGADGDSLDSVADGVYWGVQAGYGDADDRFIDFDLYQAFFGDACLAQFGADGEGCENDYGILDDPHGRYTAFLGTLGTTSVVDAATQQSYAVDGTELYALISGFNPAASAPADYVYVEFPYLVTIERGNIIAATQLWVP